MLQYRDGDARAFETLYERHGGSLFRYLSRQCRDRGRAEELFQDVWANLVRSRSRYRVEAKFTTFLFRIAHNRLIDHHRANVRNPALPAQDECDESSLPANASDDPARRANAQRQLRRLHALLDELPDEQREAFLLHEEGGLDVTQIAAATGVGRETAKSRLRYAVAKLRRALRDDA